MAWTVERDGPVATASISRPERLNALDVAAYAELISLLDDLEADRAVRVIVIRGHGTRAFAAGADITEFETQLGTPTRAMAYDSAVEEATGRLERLSKPTIAMIFGFALGSGILVAAACDLRYATDRARFAVPVARLGLMPSPPDLYRLVRLVGMANALELLLTSRQIGAHDALAMGLVTRVLPEEHLELVTRATAQQIATGAPLTQQAAKALARTYHGLAEPPSIESARAWYDRLYSGTDVREGAWAFEEKREPRFRGE